jgi:hypothetical protein
MASPLAERKVSKFVAFYLDIEDSTDTGFLTTLLFSTPSFLEMNKKGVSSVSTVSSRNGVKVRNLKF